MFFVVGTVSQDVAACLNRYGAAWALSGEVRQEPLVKFTSETVSKDCLYNPSVHMARPTRAICSSTRELPWWTIDPDSIHPTMKSLSRHCCSTCPP